MNKIVVTVIVVAIAGLGGYFLLKSKAQPTPSVALPSNQPTASQSPAPEQSSGGSPSQTPVGQTPTPKENLVIYADAGYSPAALRIKKGETVTFKNQSSRAMWPASAVHPTHRSYPTTGGCMGSTLDACKRIEPNDSWAFKFDIAGTWKYHDHLNPSDTGAIIVEQ